LFRRLWAAGAIYREIADALGLAQATISNYRKRLDLPYRDASSAERGREKVDQLHSLTTEPQEAALITVVGIAIVLLFLRC
jgi:predicted transcriptional regulator